MRDINVNTLPSRADRRDIEQLCAQEIREQLARILGRTPFRASHRLSKFLTFIVEARLAGEADRIKAYTVAVEALGRPDDFDPQADPIVRVEALRLRKALAHYYSGDGADDPLLIELPRGAYVPAFRKRRRKQSRDFPPTQTRQPEWGRHAADVFGPSQRKAGSTPLGERADLGERAEMHRREPAAPGRDVERTPRTSRQLTGLSPLARVVARRKTLPPSSTVNFRTLNKANETGVLQLISETALCTIGAMQDHLRGSHDLRSKVETILEALIHIHRSDFGNIQLLDCAAGELVIVAQRGFCNQALLPFRRMSAASKGYTSGRAVRTRAPIVLHDVFGDSRYPAVNLATQTGFRAVQSTPMITSTGLLVGVLSTHFARPHATAELDMLMTQLYARLAANILAQTKPFGSGGSTKQSFHAA